MGYDTKLGIHLLCVAVLGTLVRGLKWANDVFVEVTLSWEFH